MEPSASDRAWKVLARVTGGATRRLLGVEFDAFMSLGCGIVHRIPGSHHVSLTFDDSPQPTTHDILDVLAELRVKATFFLIGSHVRAYPEIARRIAADGHEIGNHTQHHPDLHRVSPRRLEREIVQCQQALVDVCGARPRLFRAPYGHFRWDMRALGRLGGIEALVGWDVCPPVADCDPRSIATYVQDHAGPGSIILLHDGLFGQDEDLSRAVGRAAAASLRLVVPELERRGVRFLTLGEHLARAGGR